MQTKIKNMTKIMKPGIKDVTKSNECKPKMKNVTRY
jgi:hypothetical protein